MEVEQVILDYLLSRDLGERGTDVSDPTFGLMEKGLLDSLELISLINHVEEVYGVTVPPEEYVPENFATARKIAAMINRARSRRSAENVPRNT